MENTKELLEYLGTSAEPDLGLALDAQGNRVVRRKTVTQP